MRGFGKDTMKAKSQQRESCWKRARPELLGDALDLPKAATLAARSCDSLAMLCFPPFHAQGTWMPYKALDERLKVE